MIFDIGMVVRVVVGGLKNDTKDEVFVMLRRDMMVEEVLEVLKNNMKVWVVVAVLKNNM